MYEYCGKQYFSFKYANEPLVRFKTPRESSKLSYGLELSKRMSTASSVRPDA